MSKGINQFAHFMGYKQDNSFYVQNGNVSYRQFYFEGRRQFKILSGASGRTRTYYQLLRRQLLYPVELRMHKA